MVKEVIKARIVVEAIARYSWRGSLPRDEQSEVINHGRLAAKALLEMQGVDRPTESQIDNVLLNI